MWKLVAVGGLLQLVWSIAVDVLFDDVPGRDPLATVAATALPLLAGAALVVAPAALAGRRRPDRGALRLAALAGAVQILAVCWYVSNGLRGSESPAYAVLWVLALMVLPVAAAWGVSARRFSRAPERAREPLPRRLRRGWREAAKAWSVMAGSGRLLLLPLACGVLGFASWIAAFVLAGQLVERGVSRLVLASFLMLVPGTVLGTFSGVAYLAALDRRLNGEPSGPRDGLRIAWRRRRAVLGWSLLAAGVGAVLQALQQLRSDWAVMPLLSWLAGAAWGLLMLFVLPVLALEDRGVVDSGRRAAELIRRRWGEGMAGVGNFTLVGVVVGAVLGTIISVGIAAAMLVAGPEARAAAWLTALGLFFLVIAAFGTAGQVFALALYRYAAEGRAVGLFSDDDLRHALVPRLKLRGPKR